jgi:hypothetical protein
MTDTTKNTFPAAAFSRLYRGVSRLLGRQADEQAEPVKARVDLCVSRAARRERHYAEMGLPETLLQAFSVEPLVAGDARFIGREQQMNRLWAAIESWRAGRSTMIAVTGPQGCGTTSFLQQLASLVGGDETFCYGQLTRRPYDIDDTLALLGTITGCERPVGSVDDLLEYLNSLPPKVFAIDNGHFLACRIMGATEAIRTFGAVMVATQQRHLWVLGCEDYAWRRLVYVYQADRYFTERVELPLFSEAGLGQCLAIRLQLSGITPDAGILEDNEQIPAVLAHQLSTLCKLSNGKPDLAFFYLLGALPAYDENRELELQPVVPLDFSVLKQLGSEELFTLAEVAAHGRLSIDDHRSVFRSGREESWLRLERLCHLCLLDRDETAAEPAYHLVPLYSDVITRHLNNANYLY